MAPGDSSKSSPFSCRAAASRIRKGGKLKEIDIDVSESQSLLPSFARRAPRLQLSAAWKRKAGCAATKGSTWPWTQRRKEGQGHLSIFHLAITIECQTVPRWKRHLHHVPLNDMTGHTLSQATGHKEPACKETDWTLSRRRFQRSFPLTTPPTPPFVASPKSNSFAKDEVVGESKFQRSLSPLLPCPPCLLSISPGGLERSCDVHSVFCHSVLPEVI